MATNAQLAPSGGYTEIIVPASSQAYGSNFLYLLLGLTVLLLVVWWLVRKNRRR